MNMLERVNKALKSKRCQGLSFYEKMTLKAIAKNTDPKTGTAVLTDEQLAEATNEMAFEEIHALATKIGVKTDLSENQICGLLAMQYEYHEGDFDAIHKAMLEVWRVIKNMNKKDILEMGQKIKQMTPPEDVARFEAAQQAAQLKYTNPAGNA